MRFRIFVKTDGKFVYHSTGKVDGASNKQLSEVLQKAGVVSQAILYVDDGYRLRSDSGNWIGMHPTDPRVEGLYSQAVLAERAAAGL